MGLYENVDVYNKLSAKEGCTYYEIQTRSFKKFCWKMSKMPNTGTIIWEVYEGVTLYFSVIRGITLYELQIPNFKRFRRKVWHKSSIYRIFGGFMACIPRLGWSALCRDVFYILVICIDLLKILFKKQPKDLKSACIVIRGLH